MTTTLANPSTKIGVHISVFHNLQIDTLEIKLSNQINRRFIGVIDAMVDIISENAEIPRRFCKDPKGVLLGEKTVQIPLYGIWTGEPTPRTVTRQKASPTSISENAKIIKVNG
jgi:hypothetical protein